MKNILTVVGTRPEAIKLIPLCAAFTKSKLLRNKICLTGQHTSLLDPLFFATNLKIDYQFEPFEGNPSLAQSASHMLLQFNDLLEQEKPDLIIVQGDTSTAFIASLSGFYAQTNVAHVEAGLRTGNLYSPWPEEAHRVLIDKISNYFFTPTEKAKNALIDEGIDEDKIWAVGNTSIDAIRIVKSNLKPKTKTDLSDRSIVVTIHRRENHGEPLINICNAIKNIAIEFPDIKIRFCLHPNPVVNNVVKQILFEIDNIELLLAPDHTKFVQLLDQCIFVITDSGGIQEEATFMGKPLLITRNTTEREEVIKAGTGILVGSNTENIEKHCKMLLEDPPLLSKMSKVHFPYGDGYSSERIVEIVEQIL